LQIKHGCDKLINMTKTNHTPVKPRPASTVILARQIGEELQVYLLKRNAKSGFMPGNYVFPGGTVDPEDRNTDFWKAHIDIDLESLSRQFGGNLPGEEALSYGVAAIREMFEEAGVFLSYCKKQNKEDIEKLCSSRMTSGLLKGWLQNLVVDGWILEQSKLGRWSHWITPELMPRRYDTRFFMAFMPRDQECTPDLNEVTHGIWISPEKGLAGNFKGEIPLSPPTMVTLHELLKFSSLKALKKEIKTRTWGKALLPRLLASHQEKMILEPWDPMFNKKVVMNSSELEKLILPPGEPFSRLWFHEGLWKPVRIEQ
jgi:8-oxo-dGTP pyrophosphatase MutT (NUDIX family)